MGIGLLLYCWRPACGGRKERATAREGYSEGAVVSDFATVSVELRRFDEKFFPFILAGLSMAV